MRCTWCCCGWLIFGAFIGKDGAPEDVGMKFGGRLEEDDTGMLAP